MSPTNEVRRERTAQALDQLHEEIPAWIEVRNQRDVDDRGQYLGKHKTQLAALDAVLTEALDALLDAVPNLDAESGTFYRLCRTVDTAGLLLERIWTYFRDRFDQRDATSFRPTLQAAEEVAWSCYRKVFLHPSVKRAGFTQGAVPLVYIEPYYSPAALQSDQPTRKIPTLNDAVALPDVTALLKKLPLPLLRLPPWCLQAPWWLIYIGHEVGHHIQSELKLEGYFRDGLQAAAERQGLQGRDMERWGAWGKEIFADVFSILTMGPWALWAIVEVEWSEPDQMRRALSRYPAPVVRLALMAELTRRLGLNPDLALRGLDLQALAADDERVEAHLKVVPEAVTFALGDLPDELASLKELTGFNAHDYTPHRTVARWAKTLTGRQNLSVPRKLDTARQVTSASVQAWALISRQTDAATRRTQADHLAARTLTALALSAPPGTRSGANVRGTRRGDGPDENTTYGAALCDLLLQAGRDEPDST